MKLVSQVQNFHRFSITKLSAEGCLRKILGPEKLPPDFFDSWTGNIGDEILKERALFLSTESGPLPEMEPEKQDRLGAALELCRRYANFRMSEREKKDRILDLKNPIEAALSSISDDLRFASREWLGFFPVFPFMQMGSLLMVQEGNEIQVRFSPSDLFRPILTLKCRGILLVHNHPTGSLEPSLSDLDLTKKVHDLCNQLQIQFYGHWIVSGYGQKKIQVPLP